MNDGAEARVPSRHPWILGALLLCGALVVLFAVVTIRRPAASEAVREELSSNRSALSEADARISLEPLAPPRERLESSGAGVLGEPAADEATIPSEEPTAQADFASRYKDCSPENLAVALAVVREKRLALQKSILEDRERAGLYTKVFVEPGKNYNFADMARTDADRLYPQSQTRFATHVRGGGNKPYVEISSIPPGDYPEFDAIQNEELWLHAQLRTAGAH